MAFICKVSNKSVDFECGKGVGWGVNMGPGCYKTNLIAFRNFFFPNSQLVYNAHFTGSIVFGTLSKFLFSPKKGGICRYFASTTSFSISFLHDMQIRR